MDKIIKQFSGHSGCKVFLRESDSGLYVEKIGNISRNVERMTALYDEGYPVPKILEVNQDSMRMEYLHGLDMKNYLIHNNIYRLFDFICDIIESFSCNSGEMKDYTDVYHQKLSWLDTNDEMPFTKDELIAKLPKKLPQSTYHGDMTLENIMFTDPWFNLIDPVTIEYDSYVFDIAKLRQDLECKWFLRNTDIKLEVKLQKLQDKLKHEFSNSISNPFDDNLLILMLLRVYLHTERGDPNHQFIMKEIKRLWK